MNEGMWIKLHRIDGLQTAINLRNVQRVDDTTRYNKNNGKRAAVFFTDGSMMYTDETFDEIGEMIR